MEKDLNNRLRWLEDELFEEEEPSFDLDDILSEFSEEPRLGNRAMDFDRMSFGDESFDDSSAVLVTRKKTEKTPEQSKKRKGTRGLVILAVIEVIAIVAVLLRWALWLL